jgi:hypothetical protein
MFRLVVEAKGVHMLLVHAKSVEVSSALENLEQWIELTSPWQGVARTRSSSAGLGACAAAGKSITRCITVQGVN